MPEIMKEILIKEFNKFKANFKVNNWNKGIPKSWIDNKQLNVIELLGPKSGYSGGIIAATDFCYWLIRKGYNVKKCYNRVILEIDYINIEICDKINGTDYKVCVPNLL